MFCTEGNLTADDADERRWVSDVWETGGKCSEHWKIIPRKGAEFEEVFQALESFNHGLHGWARIFPTIGKADGKSSEYWKNCSRARRARSSPAPTGLDNR
jgi:hypothetical protein